MSNATAHSPDELERELGSRLRQLRLSRNLDQAELAARAGLSIKAVQNLEGGKGSTVHSLVRVLRGLEATEALTAIAPIPSVDPLAMLTLNKPRQRAQRKRKAQAGTAV